MVCFRVSRPICVLYSPKYIKKRYLKLSFKTGKNYFPRTLFKSIKCLEIIHLYHQVLVQKWKRGAPW